MRDVGTFGQDALRIANLLTTHYLPSRQVSARDIADREKCPEVLLVTTEKSVEALAEVEALRARGFAGRVVVLIKERLTEEDMVLLHRAGADNCLDCTASPRLIQAVMLASSRNYVSRWDDYHLYRAGNLTLDALARRVTVGSTTVNLGPSGFDILYLLLMRQGRVQSREEILEQVRPRTHRNIDTRLVDVLLGRVRKLLQEHHWQGATITTVRSSGYRLDVE